MKTIRKIILAGMLAGTFFWLVPEALDKEFLYIFLGIALPSLLLSTMAIGWIFRLKGILRAHPEKAERIDRYTLENIRIIYLRPITGIAKVANLPWSVNTLSGSASGEIGGRWEIDYLDGYLLPVLAQSRLLDILRFSRVEGARLISADCVLDWGAAYPFRFYFENGQIIDWIAEREILKKAQPARLIRYPRTLCTPSWLTIPLGMVIAWGVPILLGIRLEQDMSQEMAWLGLFAMNLVLILQPWQLALGPKEVFSVPHPNNIIPISNGISFLHLKCSLATQPPRRAELYFSRTLCGLAGEYEVPDQDDLVSAIIFPALMISFSLLLVGVLSLSAHTWSFILVQGLICAALWGLVRYKAFAEDRLQESNYKAE